MLMEDEWNCCCIAHGHALAHSRTHTVHLQKVTKELKGYLVNGKAEKGNKSEQKASSEVPVPSPAARDHVFVAYVCVCAC